MWEREMEPEKEPASRTCVGSQFLPARQTAPTVLVGQPRDGAPHFLNLFRISGADTKAQGVRRRRAVRRRQKKRGVGDHSATAPVLSYHGS